MKQRFSISLRLTLWFSAVFLCGFLVFGVATWADLAYSLGHGRDRSLNNRARRALELIEATQKDSPGIRASRFALFIESTPEGNLIRVVDAAGDYILPLKPGHPDSFPWPALGTEGDTYSNVQTGGRHYRVLSRAVSLHGRPAYVVVGGQLEDNLQMLNRFSGALLMTTPALLLLSALCGYLISRRALQPVDRLTASARLISIGNLSKRLPVFGTGDELDRLASTCNHMLARLEGAVAQINQFTADASHELRSPLTLIRLSAEYAMRNPNLDPASAESFRQIVAEAEGASLLLEDMLTLARSDAGRSDVTFEHVDLKAVLAEACDRVHTLAEVKHHQVTLRVASAGPVRVLGDASSLRRLFNILLDNAIKYTPAAGAIEVELSTSESKPTVTVRDSGIGIPESALAHIFDRFYRVDAARTEHDGTGLGLAIAKWIANIHLAALTVQSSEGNGTTFQLVFPETTSA